MIRRIWLAYSVEFAKALRLRSQLLFVVLVIFSALFAATWVRPIAPDGVGDYAYIAYAAPAVMNLLGFVLLLLFSVTLISSELSSGSIRATLVRPILRHELLTAKLLLAISYGVFLTVLGAGGALLLAGLAGELTGVTYGGEMVYTAREMLTTFAACAALALAPMTAGAAVALLAGVIFRGTSAAFTALLGSWILLDMIKYPLGIERYVFTTWLEGAWKVFVDRAESISTSWYPDLWYCLASSGAVFVVAFALAVLVFARRDCCG